jgi:putative ABC transport system ATP-binding protein
VISAENVEKVYREGEVTVHALRGVSISIGRGEHVALTGPSGSGKSTLMHILGCLDRPTSGSVRVGGNDLATLSDDRLAELRNRLIGFVFQQFHLLPRLTALGNVELPLVYGGGAGGGGSVARRERRERARRALEAVELSHRADHIPAKLSGGERQRVAIARALVTEPAVILADEPTGNLDTRVGGEILGIFDRLVRERGVTLVVVTHDPAVAARAPRVVKLVDGRIVGDETRQPAGIRP